jgi:hypothetical protein
MCARLFCLLACTAYLARHAGASESNPPKWPSTVRVFSPEDTDIEDVVNAAFAENGGHLPPNHGQFSSARFAFLFKPGNYTATVPVGYYTTVAGLGASPLDVVFNGKMGVFCAESDYGMTGGAFVLLLVVPSNFSFPNLLPFRNTFHLPARSGIPARLLVCLCGSRAYALPPPGWFCSFRGTSSRHALIRTHSHHVLLKPVHLVGNWRTRPCRLDTFWRSAENFRQSTTFEWMGNAGMLWAVSQAAPLRRVVVDGDLSLYEYEPPSGGAGYSSGGCVKKQPPVAKHC